MHKKKNMLNKEIFKSSKHMKRCYLTCIGCKSSSYVGETYRHISTWTQEHLEIDKNSKSCWHLLKNPQCKSICDENYFSILNLARTKYTFKLKEGMYIK